MPGNMAHRCAGSLLRRLGLCRLLLGCVLFLGAAGARAATAPPAGFAQGNTFYSAGKYAEAKAAYEGAVRTGIYSANLFYNLGNACQRLGERGRAMLNYRRALLLEPDHAEARANLAFVQGRPAATSGGADAWLAGQLPRAGPDFWSVLAAVSGLGGLLLLVAGAPGQRGRLAGAALALTLGAAAAGLACWLDDGARGAGRAVVVAEQARALYSPAESSKVITTLRAGGEVHILSEQGAWVYAQLPDGSRAWLNGASVERFLPGRS